MGAKKVESVEFNIEKLANAHSEQNKETNRRWASSAILSVLAFSVGASPSSLEILGIPIDEKIIQPTLIIILSVINFAYCISHYAGYRTAMFLRAACEKAELKNHLVVDTYNLEDFVYSMIASNFNRIAPLFQGRRSTLRIIVQKVMKFVVDTTHFFFCPAAIVFLVANNVFDNWQEFAVVPLAILSVSVSFALWLKSLQYIRKIGG